jgi:hypothetical protein
MLLALKITGTVNRTEHKSVDPRPPVLHERGDRWRGAQMGPIDTGDTAWVLAGYSLAFGHDVGGVIGSLEHSG